MNKTIIEDTMWTFLAMGGQKGNPEILNDYVQKLLRMTKQKNAGQKGYAKKEDISFDLIDPLKWSIVCEAVALCLDERFPKIVELFKGGRERMTDNVNHPSHYTDGKIEVINFIEDKGLNFHRGNAVKYIARAGKKDSEKEVEDLRKAVWYLQREIEKLKGKEK